MSRKAKNAKNNMKHVNVRDKFDGEISRIIPISRNRSAFALAQRLNEMGENDLTVYCGRRGKASQIVAGRENHSCVDGFYTRDLTTLFSKAKLEQLSRGEIPA